MLYFDVLYHYLNLNPASFRANSTKSIITPTNNPTTVNTKVEPRYDMLRTVTFSCFEASFFARVSHLEANGIDSDRHTSKNPNSTKS